MIGETPSVLYGMSFCELKKSDTSHNKHPTTFFSPRAYHSAPNCAVRLFFSPDRTNENETIMSASDSSEGSSEPEVDKQEESSGESERESQDEVEESEEEVESDQEPHQAINQSKNSEVSAASGSVVSSDGASEGDEVLLGEHSEHQSADDGEEASAVQQAEVQATKSLPSKKTVTVVAPKKSPSKTNKVVKKPAVKRSASATARTTSRPLKSVKDSKKRSASASASRSNGAAKKVKNMVKRIFFTRIYHPYPYILVFFIHLCLFFTSEQRQQRL